MSWQLGAMLFCGWLVAMYLILRLMDFVKRSDTDIREFSEHQWKDLRRMDLRRRIEERGRKTRDGIR